MKGAFTGFTFDGVHSSDLGIVHVANGDRYSERLSADISDLTVEAMGLDGNYFFGSHFGPNHISLNIAYDSVTEEQFRRIRQLFSQKKVSELIFDERPYKKYLVKVESPIELSYVNFEEDDYTWEKIEDPETHEYYKGVTGEDFEFKKLNGKKRSVYKGEGTIELVAYFPYAKSVYKTLPTGTEDSEWAFSSGLLTEDVYTTGLYDQYNNGVVKLYNAGDVPSGIRIYIPFKSGGGIDKLFITYASTGQKESKDNQSIFLEAFDNHDAEDIGILIDTDLELIYGVTEVITEGEQIDYKLSTRIYNQHMTAGQFFKIKPTVHLGESTDEAKLFITGGNQQMNFLYDYLYI